MRPQARMKVGHNASSTPADMEYFRTCLQYGTFVVGIGVLQVKILPKKKRSNSGNSLKNKLKTVSKHMIGAARSLALDLIPPRSLVGLNCLKL